MSELRRFGLFFSLLLRGGWGGLIVLTVLLNVVLEMEVSAFLGCKSNNSLCSG